MASPNVTAVNLPNAASTAQFCAKIYYLCQLGDCKNPRNHTELAAVSIHSFRKTNFLPVVVCACKPQICAWLILAAAPFPTNIQRTGIEIIKILNELSSHTDLSFIIAPSRVSPRLSEHGTKWRFHTKNHTYTLDEAPTLYGPWFESLKGLFTWVV